MSLLTHPMSRPNPHRSRSGRLVLWAVPLALIAAASKRRATESICFAMGGALPPFFVRCRQPQQVADRETEDGVEPSASTTIAVRAIYPTPAPKCPATASGHSVQQVRFTHPTALM